MLQVFHPPEVNFYPRRNVLPNEIVMFQMKWTVLVFLLIPVFPSCETEEPRATTTTTTTETLYTAANPSSASYPVQPPPPAQARHRIVTDEPSPPAEGEPAATATPHLARNENVSGTRSTNSSTASTNSSQDADFPYGKPVPGKPGYVFSPFDKNGGYVDVTGYSAGQKVKDPYTGKIFLVP